MCLSILLLSISSMVVFFFFFKQKTAYEMRISDWSSDVCSSDLHMRVIQAYPERALRMEGALGPLQSEAVTGILTIAISEVEVGTRIVWDYVVGGHMSFEIPEIGRASCRARVCQYVEISVVDDTDQKKPNKHQATHTLH